MRKRSIEDREKKVSVDMGLLIKSGLCLIRLLSGRTLGKGFATTFSRDITAIEHAGITLYQWHQDILLYDLFGYLVTAEFPDNANR